MIIVSGEIHVAPAAREGYLADCRSIVEQARSAPGCLDFALSPDLVEPGRINVYERWASEADLIQFRGSGPSDDQQTLILDAKVEEYSAAPR